MCCAFVLEYGDLLVLTKSMRNAAVLAQPFQVWKKHFEFLY